nr:MAG TPA: HOLLIDAY JUNCTION RESOLVASE [Caudoviricetes sp.]
MIYIGIDPGKNGGIAFINEFGEIIQLLPFSEDSLIRLIKNCSSDMICTLEHVHAMPKQGVVSTFNFGMNFGFIQGVLKAYLLPFQLVPSPVWKKEFSCTSDKNTSIEVCKRLFPGVNLKATDRCKKDHDGMAEALLLAEYGRRHYNGKNL